MKRGWEPAVRQDGKADAVEDQLQAAVQSSVKVPTDQATARDPLAGAGRKAPSSHLFLMPARDIPDAAGLTPMLPRACAHVC